MGKYVLNVFLLSEAFEIVTTFRVVLGVLFNLNFTIDLYFLDLINIAQAQAATGFQLTCTIKVRWLISYDGTKPYSIYYKSNQLTVYN